MKNNRFSFLNHTKQRRILRLLLLLLLSGIQLAFSQQNKTPKSKLVAKWAVLNQIASDFSFTEGPAVDPDGNVYFTDQPNDQILKWSTDGQLTVYMKNTGRANGLYFDRFSNLIACADQDNQLWLINKDKKVTVLVDDFKGKKLNGPNDVWVDPKGGIYFTDPFYKRDYWTRTEKELDNENVYYLSPDKQSLRVAAGNFVRPNGIIGTPNGKKLYVADINDKKTYSFTINPDGSLSDRALFAEMGSDGMTIDNKGNIYLTGSGVTVFNKKGKQIEHIPVDERWTANVCFGGKKGKNPFYYGYEIPLCFGNEG